MRISAAFRLAASGVGNEFRTYRGLSLTLVLLMTSLGLASCQSNRLVEQPNQEGLGRTTITNKSGSRQHYTAQYELGGSIHLLSFTLEKGQHKEIEHDKGTCELIWTSR